MSGTPKYTYAELQEERRRQAEEERQRRAAEEAARRAAEEARLALERCNRLRQEAAGQAVSVLNRLSELETAAGNRFLPREVAMGLRDQLRQATDETRAAETESAARSVHRRIGELASRFDQLVSQVRTAARSADQLNTDLDETDGELNRVATAPSAKYLPSGATATWSSTLAGIRNAVAMATEIESLRRNATELSGVRSDIRSGGSDADAAHNEAARALAELHQLSTKIDEFARSPLRAHAESGQIEAISATAGRLTTELHGAQNGPAVAEVRRAIATTNDEFRQVAETAAVNQRSAHLAAESQTLARLRGEISSLDQARSQKFDGAGWSELQTRTDTADKHLARGELEAGRTALASARSTFNTHRNEVNRRYQRWQMERAQATESLTEAKGVLDTLRRDNSRLRWVASPLHDLERRSQDIERQIASEEFVAARIAGKALTQEATRLGSLADQLRTESERLAEVRTRLGAAQPVSGRTFDTNGARDTLRYLDAAESALKHAKLADAQQNLTSARERLTRHEQAARDASEQWQKERDETVTSIGAARDQVAALKSDPVVGKWQKSALDDWEKQLLQAEADVNAARGELDLDRPRFAQIRRIGQNLNAAQAKMVADSNRLQVQAQLQSQIASGVVHVMQELGFAVVNGLESPDNPRSAIILQASRDNGDLIDVAIEHEGRIEYAIGGRLEKTEEVGALGQTVRKCDQAEEQILRMHELLLELGIETDGLKWYDQPPPDDTSTAVQNPALATMRQNQPRSRTAGGKK